MCMIWQLTCENIVVEYGCDASTRVLIDHAYVSNEGIRGSTCRCTSYIKGNEFLLFQQQAGTVRLDIPLIPLDP